MGTLSPDSVQARSVDYRMLQCVVLLVAGVAVTSAEAETQAAISCQECIDEMHKLAYIIKGSAADIEEYLKGAYCPTLAAEEQDFCVDHLANNYVAMLFMIINHFFVDGAQHICLAWGVCHPRQDLSYITSAACSWCRPTSRPCTPWPWSSSGYPPTSAWTGARHSTGLVTLPGFILCTNWKSTRIKKHFVR